MWITNSIVAFCLAVLVHSFYSRVNAQKNRVLGFIKIGTPLGIALCIVNSINYGFISIPQFSSIFLYAFVCELYIFLFTFSLASISANILVTMRSGPTSIEEIEKLYDSKEMVSKRFDRLISSGFLKTMDNNSSIATFQITPSGTRFVSIINFLRLIFNH